MLDVSAYGATSATDPLVPLTIGRREVGPLDVLIDIKFCGICHSDIHTVRGEWSAGRYPLVPGHEIAGIVAGLGSDVTGFAIGDRVGVGCMVDSCGTCAACLEGEEQHCLTGNTLTYGSVGADGEITQGGYSTRIVVTEKFVVKIPEGLALDVAAPLLCAGITTYSPLRYWKADEATKVGVIGLGGLGHMAVKLAHAMGCEVTVLSQTMKKQEDAAKLGADRFYATGDGSAFKDLARSLDLVINTVSAPIDLDAYLSLLALNGTLINVGASPDPLSLRAFSLIRGRRSFAGSLIGGIRETQEMLDFCAEQNVGSEIELIVPDQVNEAYERVMASDVRYRFVIDMAGLN